MRSRPEPNQVVQAGFGLGRIAVTEKVNGCYCASARDTRLWRIQINFGTAQRKPPKGGQKERLHREGHADLAEGVKNLPRTGDVKNDTAGL